MNGFNLLIDIPGIYNFCDTFSLIFIKKRKELRWICDNFYLLVENQYVSIVHVYVIVL